MTDVHCHILPNVDDGAASFEEAMAMARLAVDSGVRRIAATPHFYGARESLAQIPVILSRLEGLQEMVRQEGLELQLYPGVEVLCTPETPKLAAQRLLPTIGRGNYFLTEFFFDESTDFMDETLEQIAALGYIPLIAHPERYFAVQKNPRTVQRWFREGYAVQVNKGSVLGAFGSRSESAAHELLEHGFVHMIASDAHHSDHRTTHMRQVYDWSMEQLGERYTQILFRENPSRVIGGRELVPVA